MRADITKINAEVGVCLSVTAAISLMQASEFSKPSATVSWLLAALALLWRMKTRRLPQDASPMEIFHHEVSDGISDPIVLIAAGYCNDWVVKIANIPVGWVAAVLAVLSILIRVLGEALTSTSVQLKPMASPERLIVLIVACLGSVAELWLRSEVKFAQEVMRVALGLIVLGTAMTCINGVRAISRQLAGQR